MARRKGSEWEILGNLEHGGVGGTSYMPPAKPRRYEGFMSKKRKWPLKGWHKRYFIFFCLIAQPLFYRGGQ